MLLYHYPLCPLSRKVRLLLYEKRILFNEKIISFDKNSILANDFMDTIPVLSNDGMFLSNAMAISEYIEEKFKDSNFIGISLKTRANVRKISLWVDNVFYKDAVLPLIIEKIFKPINEQTTPSSKNIRVALEWLIYYAKQIEKMILQNTRLACEDFTLADITLASHISSLDYMNDFPWDKMPVIKNWYSVIKSRPSFRNILNDRIPYMQPPIHYARLDF